MERAARKRMLSRPQSELMRASRVALKIEPISITSRRAESVECQLERSLTEEDDYWDVTGEKSRSMAPHFPHVDITIG
jgi:hypothetical protein